MGRSRGSTGSTSRSQRSRARSANGLGARGPDGEAFAAALPAPAPWLALLAVAAPLIWVLERLAGHRERAVVADQHAPHRRRRCTARRGSRRCPSTIPRRIGEILGPAVLAGAALGGVLSLSWLRAPRAARRARGRRWRWSCSRPSPRAGLPIDTRYAFLAAAILCVFCGAGLCGWMRAAARATPAGAGGWRGAPRSCSWRWSPRSPRSTAPTTTNSSALGRQQRIQDDLVALVDDGAITVALRADRRAQPRPDPAARAVAGKRPPSSIVSAQLRTIARGTYVDPADRGGPARLHPRPQRPPPAGRFAPRLHGDPRQPLVADLPALPGSGPCTPRRAPQPIADRRSRLRIGNARCACRGSLKAASFRT